MTITEQRNHFPELLDQVDDEFFSTVYAMLEIYVRKQQEDPVIGYTLYGQPKYASHMKAVYAKQIRAAEEDGQFMTVDELEEAAESW
ncbi:MAG: hypothetical protein AAFN92_06995 [Bacteroidota bacterium]